VGGLVPNGPGAESMAQGVCDTPPPPLPDSD